MKSVGTNRSSSVTTVNSAVGKCSVLWPTKAMMRSDRMPKLPMISSTIPNTASRLSDDRRDRYPPARLPKPNPSRKPATTMVTASTLMPYIVKSERCQMSW